MLNLRRRPTRTYTALLTVGLCTGFAAALATMQVNAESPTTQDAAEVSGTTLRSLLDGDVTPTSIPLTSSLQPTTPWPAAANAGNISQTLLEASHDLLAYIGVDTTARKMLGADYTLWHSHFNNHAEASALPQSGLLMATGCLKPQCNLHKSLIIVDPETQKVYAAMVTEGKVAMWPSLMTWPDAAVPPLKDWLSESDTPSAK